MNDNPTGSSIAIEDIDGDGDLDMVTGGSANEHKYL